jgi:hypothetical protein
MTSNSKEWVQYLTASAMVFSGIILAFCSFFTTGDVKDGVLWYIGESLTFAGGIFGVSIYFKSKLGESKSSLIEYIDSIIKDKEVKK